MVSIGKINIGRKERRAFFPLNHDVNTTSDFGFCQPTLIRHFIKGSKISLKSKTFVRLAPLPVPTFGRIECKQHTSFVPVKEVFEAFDYQQANKSVSSALRSYVPVTTDYCSNIDFYRYMHDIFSGISPLFFSDFNKWASLLPFRLSIWVKAKNIVWNGVVWPTLTKALGGIPQEDDWIDIFNDERLYGVDSPLDENEKCQMYSLAFWFAAEIPQCFTNYFHGNELHYGVIDYSSGQITSDNVLPLSVFSYPLNKVPQYFDPSSELIGSMYHYGHYTISIGGSVPGTPYSLPDTENIGYFTYEDKLHDLQDSRLSYLFNPMTVQNADFLHKFPVSSDTDLPVTEGGYTVQYKRGSFAVGVHLTPNGKRLMKVYNACRINFGRSHPVSMNGILAYYKAWFDKYNAGRNIQWRDTAAYKLIHTYYDTGLPSALLYHIETGASPYDFVSDTICDNVRYNLLHFLTDIYDCVYCSKLDNITVATDSPVLENTQPNDSSYVDLGSTSNVIPYVEGAGDTFNIPQRRDYATQIVENSNNPYYRSTENNGLSVRFLQTIYKLVNKNSVLGAKVDDYLRAHGIANGLPKTKVLGDTSFMCNLDEVFGTVNNDSTQLGEYAGKGAGFSDGEKMHFETEEFGYLVQLTTLVPFGGYVQGDTQDPIFRYDFYQEAFDGLGMEPLPQSAIIGRQSCLGAMTMPDTVFGFVPRYMSLKVQNNLANGGFSFASEQSQFLPYSLDKIFSVGSPSEYITEDYTTPITKYAKDVVCDEELRYIGRYEKYGNFDRIFYDTTGITDNFIIHIIQDLTMYAPMRAIDNSFETYDEFNDDSSVKLEHA